MSTTLIALQSLQDHSIQGAHVQVVALQQHMATENPFKGLKPDFKILGTVFKNKWTTAFAAVWACAIIYVGFKFIPAILAYANHRGNHHPGAQSEALTEVKKTGTAFAGLICLVPIIGVVYAVMS